MDFVKTTFADVVHKKIPNMKANDTIVIATGAAAQYVGGATVQHIVSDAYQNNLDENALARKLTQTAAEHAYLVDDDEHASSCMVVYLTEKLQ